MIHEKVITKINKDNTFSVVYANIDRVICTCDIFTDAIMITELINNTLNINTKTLKHSINTIQSYTSRP